MVIFGFDFAEYGSEIVYFVVRKVGSISHWFGVICRQNLTMLMF